MIANEFGEAASDPLHRAALIAAGLVLFVLTLLVNAIARCFVAARRAQATRRRPDGDGRMSAHAAPARHRAGLARAAGAPTRSRAASLLGGDADRARPARPDRLLPAQEGPRRWSWSFFTTDPTGSFLGDPGGIKRAILGTIEIVALATLIAVPIGIGVALYLVEYGKRRRLRATSSATSST